jgi:acyl-CoA synthetase (NDP forming)
VPSFPSPETAVRALGRAAEYAAFRRRPSGVLPELAGIDLPAARLLVQGPPRQLSATEARELLACIGVQVVPETRASSAEEAVAAATAYGLPAAVKALAGSLRHRGDLGGVRLDLTSPEAVRAAYEAIVALGGEKEVLVQPMAPPGVATVVGVELDPSFGPLVTFGVGGVAVDLLEDRAARFLPLSDLDAGEMVHSVRAAPLLLGWRGAAPVDVPALEDLLLRVGRLADEVPEVLSVELNPVVVSEQGVHPLHAGIRVGAPTARPDTGPRRLT